MNSPRCALHGQEHCPLCSGQQPTADGYPVGWPRCKCGRPVLDGHLTCGRYECSEAGARRASPYNLAIGTDGNPMPYSPENVKRVALKAVDDGELLAAVFRLPTGDSSVQIFGPPSYELVEILESAVAQYKRVLGLQVAPPAGRA